METEGQVHLTWECGMQMCIDRGKEEGKTTGGDCDAREAVGDGGEWVQGGGTAGDGDSARCRPGAAAGSAGAGTDKG